MIDRKSVVQGKSVDLGGRRIIKKNFFQAEDGIRDHRGDWSSDVCSSDLQLGDSQDMDKEVTLSKEELKQILDKISTNKLVKTYSLGRGGQDRDHLTISYQVNNQNYTFEVFAGSIVLDSADEEIKNIFNNSNYEERNTEYKNQAGAFYYYSIEEYNESIFDEYFKQNDQ